MQVKSKSGRAFKVPTAEEDARINAGINADPDTYELSDQEFKQLRKVGRPPATETKEKITIRLSRMVVAKFRATGPGWQTRIDNALADWLREHKTGA